MHAANPEAPMPQRMYTLVIDADNEAALEDARAEATRLINEGYLSGHNSNDSGAFYFESTDNVPEGQLPNR